MQATKDTPSVAEVIEIDLFKNSCRRQLLCNVNYKNACRQLSTVATDATVGSCAGSCRTHREHTCKIFHFAPKKYSHKMHNSIESRQRR